MWMISILKQQLKELKTLFVRSVEKSMRPDINMNFDNRLGNKEVKAEEPVEFEEQNTEIVLADFVH